VTKLFLLDYAVCWFKYYYIINLLQGMCIMLNLLKNLKPTAHVT